MCDEKQKINWLSDLSENTSLKKYLRQIEENIIYGREYEVYKDNVDQQLAWIKENKAPFLTVLIRTQGKREDGLREALLCLSAQTNMNYEIVLIGHKVERENKKIILNILEDQSEEFRGKIRYYEINEGTRTVPLNYGFSMSRASYIAVFDDDDILFDNWVEAFFEGSKKNYGQILHSYAFSQNWRASNELGYMAEAAPTGNYCRSFQLLPQMTVNRCPLMTLAFPMDMFRKFGITFNENLNVMEDWEYFMRLAFICGVADIPTPTAIYRFWKNVETSATLHDQNEWQETYERIQKSFADTGKLFPSGEVFKLMEMLSDNGKKNIVSETMDQSFLYYSDGSPFDDGRKIAAFSEKTYPEFDLWFLFENKTDKIKALRFDLTEEGLFILTDIHIDLWFTNGDKKIISLKDCVYSGIDYSDCVLFLHEDPEIIWELDDTRFLDVVHIYGKVSRTVSRKSKKLNLLETLMSYKQLKKKMYLHKKGLF